eukprot:UN22778
MDSDGLYDKTSHRLDTYLDAFKIVKADFYALTGKTLWPMNPNEKSLFMDELDAQQNGDRSPRFFIPKNIVYTSRGTSYPVKPGGPLQTIGGEEEQDSEGTYIMHNQLILKRYEGEDPETQFNVEVNDNAGIPEIKFVNPNIIETQDTNRTDDESHADMYGPGTPAAEDNGNNNNNVRTSGIKRKPQQTEEDNTAKKQKYIPRVQGKEYKPPGKPFAFGKPYNNEEPKPKPKGENKNELQ